MNVKELEELFGERNDGEFLEFDRIELKRSSSPDLHAFKLLERLVDINGDIVCAAEHDTIYLGVSVSELAKVITEQDIIDLIRCGVIYDEETESLMMFA